MKTLPRVLGVKTQLRDVCNRSKKSYAATGDRTRSAGFSLALYRVAKSQLVLQGSTSVSYTYHYYIFLLHFKIRPRILIWATTQYYYVVLNAPLL